jgi:hypothetical protein
MRNCYVNDPFWLGDCHGCWQDRNGVHVLLIMAIAKEFKRRISRALYSNNKRIQRASDSPPS